MREFCELFQSYLYTGRRTHFVQWDPYFPFYSCMSGPALISRGCYHKLSQTWWLKTQKCILSQLWRAEAGNQAVCKATLPPQALGETPFPVSSSFRWVWAFAGLWPQHLDLHFHLHMALPSVWVSVCPYLFHKQTYGCI